MTTARLSVVALAGFSKPAGRASASRFREAERGAQRTRPVTVARNRRIARLVRRTLVLACFPKVHAQTGADGDAVLKATRTLPTALLPNPRNIHTRTPDATVAF